MDPISGISLALELTTICVSSIRLLKRTIESIRTVRLELLELLNRTERMRNILELLRTLLQELQKTPDGKMELRLNEFACRETMKELENLAKKIAGTHFHSSFLAGTQWLSYKGRAKELIEKLRGQEVDIVNILTIVGVTSSLKSEQKIQEMKEEVTHESEAVSAFKELSLDEKTPQTTSHVIVGSPSPGPRNRRLVPTWLGYLVQDGHPTDYIRARSHLSDAAYWGEWDDFWSIHRSAVELYQETWINAIRMKTLEQAKEMSFWTPLHQAIYTHFDKETTFKLVEQLLNAGASRTLRTRWTNEFAYKDMTPLELAHQLGYEFLYKILAPVIRQPIPTKVLSILQERFHHLIKEDLNSYPNLEYLYLPELEVLTEMEVPLMWFPINTHGHSAAGYGFRLDGRELVVRSYNVKGENTVQTYRFTQTETRLIEEALVFGA